ncbi:hypothetical protein QWY84_03130 [Aquisalimonas lutea]|uniref:hypothetical protein n=1 Tax=Aquisalimonas lutea TaxID=1327750 RepID=UPI0025B5082C|nr:hypothetical protein [Aquisalimonas lutea]MDN3516595.1 hypothetical protein [Aquisalimonas lutea]
MTLAVGGVVGGNAFDTLFAAIADWRTAPARCTHGATERETFLIALSIVMAAVLLPGLLRRERHGITRIGFESFAVLLLNGLALFVTAWL